MKIKALVVAVFLNLTIAVNAQSNGLSGIFGLKGGINLATLEGDEVDGQGAKTVPGFHFGVLAEIPLSEKFAVQPEAWYSSQGGTDVFREIEITLQLDYINVPVKFKYYFFNGFNLELGAQVGFLVRQNLETKGLDEGIKVNLDDSFKTFDFGPVGGIGYRFENGFFLEATYYFGIANILNNEQADGYKQFNRVLQGSIGYFF